MNRVERKREERELEKSKKVQLMTRKQIQTLDNAIRDDEVARTRKVFMAVMLNSLNANYKFGTKRLQKVVDDMNGQLNAVSKRIVDPHEIVNLARKFKVKDSI